MELTVLGVVLIPLGLILLFHAKRYLFWATVVSAPFFDTSIMLLPSFTTLVRPSYYFGALLVVRCLMDYSVRRNKFRATRTSVLAFMFLASILISSSMPFFFQGELYVIPTESSVSMTHTVEYETLSFSKSSVTQLFYPFFLVVFFLVTTDYLTQYRCQRTVMRVFVLCAFPIIVSGVIYVVLLMLGLDSLMGQLYWLVNGGRELRISGDTGLGGLPLMFSLAGEPGYTGMCLLLVLGPILAALYYRDTHLLKSQAMRIVTFTVVVVTLVLAGGTTGYVGLVILVVVSLAMILFREGRQGIAVTAHFRVAFLLGAVLLVTTFGYSQFFESSFVDYVSDVHVSKIQGTYGSGEVRKAITLHNLETFRHSPLFGVGYGNDRGLAMSVFLLANVGIVGTAIFYALIFSVIHRAWRYYRDGRLPHDERSLLLGLLLALTTMFLLMQFAKSESALLFICFWILLACTAAYHPSPRVQGS